MRQSRSKEGTGQQADQNRRQTEDAIPVETHEQGKSLIAVHHRLHVTYPLWRFDTLFCAEIVAALRRKRAEAVAFATQRPAHPDQGQKISLPKAKTISVSSAASPSDIKTRKALSLGGFPVTAS